MFAYSDPIFQATSTSQVKDTDFTSTTSPTAIGASNNGPMYVCNDMIYSVEQHNMSTTNLGIPQQHQNQNQHQQQHQHQHHHHHYQQQMWQEQQQQHTNSYFTPEIQQQQDHSPYDHYNVSPFSSPLINTNNTMLMGTISQRSSVQSLPSIHPIPPTPTSVQQQHQHQQLQLQLQLQLQQQQQQQQHQQHQQQQQQPSQRPRITTSLWDDEETVCYQVDVRGICVARRQDNDMVNGTKLLNVTGMSRGKRDGILKNEKGRVVVKVGAMHLKGVWVTFARAKALAIQFNIADQLHPLFVDDPALYFYSNQLAHNYYSTSYLPSQDLIQQQNKRPSFSAYPMYSNNNSNSSLEFPVFHSNYHYPSQQHLHQQPQHHSLPAAPSVPSMIPLQHQNQMSLYGYTTSSSPTTASVVAHHHIPTTATTTAISTTTNPAIIATDDSSIMNHY